MPRLHGYRDPGWFSESEAWNRYCAAINRGASDVLIQRYRDRYERVVAARARFRDEQRKWAEWPRQNPVAITLAPPRRVTSTAIAKVINPGLFAFMLTASAMLCESIETWALCVGALPVVYIWWLVTGATIRAAAQFDDHPIPPARVLSEGPR